MLLAKSSSEISKTETIKLRKEIREALKEEGYQGNELKEKIDKFFNQELLRQDEERKRQDKESERIRQDETRKAEERRALELKKINQAKSREEKIRLCNQYIYELHERERKRRVAERFSELEQKESTKTTST